MVNMAGVHDDAITFGVICYAYITTVEKEENQPERRTRRVAVRQLSTISINTLQGIILYSIIFVLLQY